MRNIKLVIQFDGTNYCGWQRQINGLSVQEVLENALSKILGEKIIVIGAGRTDSGVHAEAMTANFKTSSKMNLKRLHIAINFSMPFDISVKSVSAASISFDAQRDSKGKVYRYDIYHNTVKYPFKRDFSMFIHHDLDIGRMKAAAKYFKGRHDFAAFRSAHGAAVTSERTIKSVRIKKNGSWISIFLEADGFLYNMARTIVGTLLEVGRGKLSPEDIKRIINSKNRVHAGPTAPAKGLFLVKVKYK